MKLLIKYPTRGRPRRFLQMLDKYVELLRDRDDYDLRVTADDDDASMNNPAMRQAVERYPRASIVYGNARTKVEAVNADIESCSNWQLLMLISDDMDPQLKGYDRIIRDRMHRHYPDTDGVLFFNDGSQGSKLNTLPIVGRRYYERFGYVYHPDYISFYCDNEFTEVAHALNKMTYFPEVLARHRHFAWEGTKPDELYCRNGRFSAIDGRTFERRKEAGFPPERITAARPLFVSFHTGGLYENEATGLAASLDRFDLDHEIVAIRDRRDWIRNVNYKPSFLRPYVAAAHRPIVWLDADARVLKSPDLFAELAHRGVDVAVHTFRGHQVASGTVYLGPTARAQSLVDQWAHTCTGQTRLNDQECLARVLGAVPSLVAEELPAEYCCIFDLTREDLPGIDPVVEHRQASRRARAAAGDRRQPGRGVKGWIRSARRRLRRSVLGHDPAQLERLQAEVGELRELLDLLTREPRYLWLYTHREHRMDATVPIFDELRRAFHLARYRFASRYVRDRSVADIACGTGYGAELLRVDGGASCVVGIDNDEEAVEYASRLHGPDGVRFVCASASESGLPDGSVDVVTSFETIEHVPSDREMLEEFGRILSADGTLVVSTPNSWPLERTPHHVREYDRTGFEQLLADYFDEISMFNQNSGTPWEFNHDRPAGIVPTTDANQASAECFIALCRGPRAAADRRSFRA